MVTAVMFLGLAVVMMLELVLVVSGVDKSVSQVLRFGVSDADAVDVGNSMMEDSEMVMAVVTVV